MARDNSGEDREVKKQSLFKGPAVLKATFEPYPEYNRNGKKTRNGPLPPLPAWEIRRLKKLYGGE